MSTSPEGARLPIADLRKVIETLSREVDLLWKLASVLETEQGSLVRGDVEGLRGNVESQIALVREIASLEEVRRSLVRPDGRQEHGAKGPNLEALIAAAPADEAASLDGIRSALRAVLDALGRVNKHNNLLIRQSLAYIDKTLKLAAGEDAAGAVYTSNGDVRCPTGQIKVDRTV
jgi:flagellar biosynthesis/type III secretory pathway chaperone